QVAVHRLVVADQQVVPGLRRLVTVSLRLEDERPVRDQLREVQAASFVVHGFPWCAAHPLQGTLTRGPARDHKASSLFYRRKGRVLHVPASISSKSLDSSLQGMAVGGAGGRRSCENASGPAFSDPLTCWSACSSCSCATSTRAVRRGRRLRRR